MKLKSLLLATMLLAGMSVHAQMQKIPTDESVRIGKLDNGLTYYIRHNGYPEKVASFYIAQKVGSVQENEDQRGLAHLLEHMAFNGSDHFKDNALQEYLQSIGVEYGRNLNAYTSTDQTVYYIQDVPTTRISALDSCLLVLKDWSNGITLSAERADFATTLTIRRTLRSFGTFRSFSSFSNRFSCGNSLCCLDSRVFSVIHKSTP